MITENKISTKFLNQGASIVFPILSHGPCSVVRSTNRTRVDRSTCDGGPCPGLHTPHHTHSYLSPLGSEVTLCGWPANSDRFYVPTYLYVWHRVEFEERQTEQDNGVTWNSAIFGVFATQ